MSDNVQKAAHYNHGDIEVIDFVRGLPFSAGNAVKYIARAPYKDDAHQDLRKAMWYIRDMICQQTNTDHAVLRSCVKTAVEELRRASTARENTDSQDFHVCLSSHVGWMLLTLLEDF